MIDRQDTYIQGNLVQRICSAAAAVIYCSSLLRIHSSKMYMMQLVAYIYGCRSLVGSVHRGPLGTYIC
jgi:uncharacterized membrane-anchored protein